MSCLSDFTAVSFKRALARGADACPFHVKCLRIGCQKRVLTIELDFHIWNANWPMKCEAKMAAHGRQFCTSILVPYAVLYVSFSLPCYFLHFLKCFL